jgi:hypothetical protein
VATEHTWPVTSYSVTIWGPGFGVIHLKDGDEDAGYIYFRDEPPDTGIFRGGRPYIVMSQPKEMWLVILDILRNERPLYIRGYQANDGDPVSYFFGTTTDEPVGEGE